LISVAQVERERSLLLLQTFKQLNTQYSRRMNGTGCPLVVHRVKVTFRDEPGEGSGVARSFYTAFSQAVLSAEKLPNLDPALVGGKSLQYSTTAVYLWPPFVIGQVIYIFILSFVLLSFFFLFFFPRLISAIADWMSTILAHMVWP